jgi:hypothetical protein
MTTTKIGNITFSDNINYLHKAYDPIIAYSVVFGVFDQNIIKVYTSQNTAFDNGNPWAIGIAQNNAEIGETVEVKYSGMSAIRFYGHNTPSGTDLYLLKNIDNQPLSNGATCLRTDSDVEPYKKIDGQMLMIGHVLPRTQPLLGYVQFPRYYTINVYIQFAGKL